MLKLIAIYSGVMFFALMACNNPKVIESSNAPSYVETIATEHLHQSETPNSDPSAGHTIEVKEVLQAEKYSYVRAEEAGKELWVVVPKSDIKVGQSYYYEGGLFKRNYKSLEFDKTFESIYLVSHLKPAQHKKSDSSLDEAFAKMKAAESSGDSGASAVKVEGITSLTDLLSSPEKYKGKLIKVQGKCVKVNNEIMGKNWIHIQDGESSNGKLNDLTITTSENILMGMDVVMEGKIALDKDFGAGYWYDIIMEGAVKK